MSKHPSESKPTAINDKAFFARLAVGRPLKGDNNYFYTHLKGLPDESPNGTPTAKRHRTAQCTHSTHCTHCEHSTHCMHCTHSTHSTQSTYGR